MAKKTPLSVAQAWDVMHEWLDENAPMVRKKLNKPATKKAIGQLEKTLGFELPADFIASYLIHDGSHDVSGPIIGVPLLSLAQIAKEWKTLKQRNDGVFESLDQEVSYKKEVIREDPYNPKWIPFAGPDEHNYIGLDFDPGPKGTSGQVINFGADEFIYGSNRFVLARSFRDFMGFLADQFATGKVELNIEDDDPESQTFLQLVRRRDDGTTCNLLTGVFMIFGNES